MVFEDKQLINAHVHIGFDPVISDLFIVHELNYVDIDGPIKTLERYGIERVGLLQLDRIHNSPVDTEYRSPNEAGREMP